MPSPVGELVLRHRLWVLQKGRRHGFGARWEALPSAPAFGDTFAIGWIGLRV